MQKYHYLDIKNQIFWEGQTPSQWGGGTNAPLPRFIVLYELTYKVTCGLTVFTLGSAPGPTLGNEYWRTFLLPLDPCFCGLYNRQREHYKAINNHQFGGFLVDDVRDDACMPSQRGLLQQRVTSWRLFESRDRGYTGVNSRCFDQWFWRTRL